MTTTPLQEARWAAYQVEGGDGSPGAQSRTARTLGITQGALASSLEGYRRITGIGGEVARIKRQPRPTEMLRDLPARLEALETQVANAVAGVSALAELQHDLARSIHEWTDRQPIYVEMRPRHQRVVDGGEGGLREARRLRKVAGE